MAPRGRKSKASKETGVSAASRKWKVGDLVLAKIRGFPAWPAMVAEPEKCGYSAEWKKVLVCFFGTNEIAFLNPADVEAFTKEKKEALLAQRRGKSTDFVRALQEIIEIFDNPTNKNPLDDFNEIAEVIGTNLGNSVDSLPSSRHRNQGEGSSGTLSSGLNSYFNGGTYDRSTCSENVRTTAFNNRDTLSEEPTDNVVAATSFVATTYISNKSSELPQSSVSQTGALWSRKNISSKNLKKPSIDGNKSVINIVPKTVMDDSLIRNKTMMNLPDAYDVTVSSACVSHGETESKGSSGVTVDPEAHHYNECSNFEVGGNHELNETVKGFGVDLVVGRIPDYQYEHAVFNKKRKANRKRDISYLPELSAAPDKVNDEEELQQTTHGLPNIREKSSGMFAKEVGDEYLPLIKRARVRMGNLSTSEEKLDHLIKMEDSSSKDAPLYVAVGTSLNCGADENRKSFTVKEDTVNPLPSNTRSHVPDNMPKDSDNGKIQVSESLDGEAALPPSKRLHRALKVMSAHVPEDDLACAETSRTNGGCVSHFVKYHHQSRETKAKNLEDRYEDSYGQSALKNQTSRYLVDVNLFMSEENKRSSVVSNSGTNLVRCSHSLNDEFEAEEGEIQVTNTYNFLQNQNVIPANFRTDQDSLDKSSPKNGKICESIGPQDEVADAVIMESDTSKSTRISTGYVSGADMVTKVSPKNDASTALNHKTKESAFGDSTKLIKITPDGCQINDMCETAIEDNRKSYKNSQKLEIWRTKHVPDASPIYDDKLDKNYVSGVHLKLSSAYGPSLTITQPPPEASLLYITDIGSKNSLRSNGCCSPEVELHGHNKKSDNNSDVNDKKSDLAVTSMGRSNSVGARDCLRSLETVLGALTRKKESMGRATDIGIECAKEGFATKVLDILVRSMENERSLRKRLDLFFLLDSITQGCLSLKGDVCETFFAAIQSGLPRVLLAAAPPGNTGRENRRQCLKVLRLWLERRVLPKFVVQHHIWHINSLNYLPSFSAFSKRQHNNERAFDDPIREMGGFVDEYGSNSSIQIPDFCMPRTFDVEANGSDSDSGTFEAVTPEHNSVTPEEQELTPMARKHIHVLGYVDNELDMMDDMSPSNAMSDVKNVASSHTSKHEQLTPSFLVPPLPDHEPPTLPPLPSAADLELFLGTNVNNMQAKLEWRHPQVSSTIKPVISQSVKYRNPKLQNLQMETCLQGSTYDRNPVSPLPVGHMNFPPRRGGEVLYSKAYFLPPPPLRTPSSQFSYSQVDRQMPAGRNAAFLHCNRYNFQPNSEGKAFHAGHHGRYNLPDFNERWRCSRSSFSGPFHPHERDGLPSVPAPYMEGEPARRRNHGLICPSWEMNYRNTMPIRSSFEAPRNWRQK